MSTTDQIDHNPADHDLGNHDHNLRDPNLHDPNLHDPNLHDPNLHDPMDDTLAAIASILDHAPIDREPDRTVAEDRLQPGLAEADGYHKVGPGPFDAIRFKWTVRRRDSGDYDVEERIGAASRPLLTGPMSAAAAIRLVDEREYQARQNYEKLRGEMSGNGSAANRTHGEA